MKICKICSKIKSLDEFYSGRTQCKYCYHQKRKSYYKNYRIVNRNKLYEWRSNNPEKMKQYQESYWEQNKDEIIKRRKNRDQEWWETDYNFRLKKILRNRLYAALRGNTKRGSAVSDLGCSIKYLKVYLESQFKPGMSWDNYGEWHIDHIIPISSFNLQNRIELKKACHFTNLQPLWAKENLVKGASRG